MSTTLLSTLQSNARAIADAIDWHREQPENPVRLATIHVALGDLLATMKRLGDVGLIREHLLMAAVEEAMKATPEEVKPT